ncbi:MAG: hypothetical protein MUP15_04890 [Dehalococcoidia bacterium]|nr:hypothetical protein [Dehalococcoidia bacterium]
MFPLFPLILISFPLVYLWYAGFMAWALRRTHRGAIDAGRLRDWRITAWAMALLPFAGCAGALLMASQTESAAALILSFYAAGAFLLAAGLLATWAGAPTWPLLLRLAGWGLIAGLTIVPSTLVLLLPLVSLLAFVVPEDYRRRQARAIA